MSRMHLNFLFLLTISISHNALAATFTPIPLIDGATEMRASDLSFDGQVIVGETFMDGHTRAFRWNTMDPIPTLLDDLPFGSTENRALSLSGNGNVAVGQGLSGSGAEATVWRNSEDPMGLGDLANGFYSSRANGVSADGVVAVGTGYSEMGREAFRWTEAGGMQGLGHPSLGVASEAFDVSSDGSTVVGVSETFNAILGEAFYWTEESGMVGLGDLPGGDFMSRANAVSNSGDTIVGVSSTTNGDVAFRWTSAAGIETLGVLPGGTNSSAHGVSADGNTIIGEASTQAALPAAFLWTQESGMQDLAEVLRVDYGLSSELDGWHLTSATAVSPNGSFLVGTGINPAGDIRAWHVDFEDSELLAPDFDDDGVLSIFDIDALSLAIRTGSTDNRFDVNMDGSVNATDHREWIDVVGFKTGDTDLDGNVTFTDFLRLAESFDKQGGWGQGDFDGSGAVVFTDFLALAANFNTIDVAAAQVPEPQSAFLLLIGVAILLRRDRQA